MPNTKVKKTGNPIIRVLVYFLSLVLSVVVIIYLGYHFVNSFSNELVTESALLVTENDTAEFDAYIFRNETVVYSTISGSVGYTFPDGTKVRKDSTIASIYEGATDSGSHTRDDIIALDREIELLNQSGKIEGFSVADTQTIDNRISEHYYKIRSMTEQDSYSNLPVRRDELLKLLNKRQIVTGTVESFDDVIESLKSERDLLTERLDTVSETITAPTAGFFSSVLDGYENLFREDATDSLTFDKFDKMTSSEPESYPGTAIGKIATDFTWSIVLETNRNELRYYIKGESYDIIFPYNNDLMLNMQLSEIITADAHQRVLLVFSCSELPANFSFRRMQPIKIVRNSYTGYRVPISAVRLLDDKKGVYIVVGSTVDFRYIDVILEADGYYIAAPQNMEDPEYYTKLSLYDVMITEGKDLYIGKIVS